MGIFVFSAWSVFCRPPKRSKATLSVASTHLCNKTAGDTTRDLLGSSCVAQCGRLQPGCLSPRIPSNEFSRGSSRCSLRAPRRSGALAALPRTAVASLASVTQVTSGTCNSTGATSSIESLDAHKVRSEEATTRRRERRKDPERMKLKRAAKVQRCEGHSSAQVVAEGSVTAPREYVSAAKPVEREPSSVRRWYLLGNLIGTKAAPVDRQNPSYLAPSCGDLGLSELSDPQLSTFSPEREEKKTSNLCVILVGVMPLSDGPALVM